MLLQSANSAMKRRSLAEEKTRNTRNPEELVERLRE